MGFYVSLRLAMNEEGEFEYNRAQEQHDAARAALRTRIEWVEPEYPLIADGFQRLLDETEGGKLTTASGTRSPAASATAIYLRDTASVPTA